MELQVAALACRLSELVCGWHQLGSINLAKNTTRRIPLVYGTEYIQATNVINSLWRNVWAKFGSTVMQTNDKIYEILEICWIWTIISLVHWSTFLVRHRRKVAKSQDKGKFVDDTEPTETVNVVNKLNVGKLIDINKFSKWLRLVMGTTAWVFKYIDKCRNKSI